jgi:hypothetical protein
VQLFDNTQTRICRLTAANSEIGKNKSWGLAVDGVIAAPNHQTVSSDCRVYAHPTPGLPNAANDVRYEETSTVPKPTLSVPPGFYTASQNVVLNTTAGHTVHYTLDGSDPRETATFVYAGNAVTISAASPVTSGLSWIRTNPVEISQPGKMPTAAWQAPIGSVPKAVVLRAIAVDPSGKNCSSETRGTYFIGPAFTGRTLPVASLVTDADNLFGFTSGIYVPGKAYADSPEGYGSNRWGKPYANYHQDGSGQAWERPAHLEWFEPLQNTASVAQLLGVAMHGGGTRAIPQKTLYLISRNGEYGSASINHALFPGEAAASYKRVLLRNSGNDWYGPDYGGVATMMKDAVFHRMIRSLDLSLQAYRPAVTYINGEYWGIHNLRESIDKHYPATRYGLDSDNIDLLMHEEGSNDKVKITRIEGDKDSDNQYKALIDWIKGNPLSSDANYQQAQAQLDVTSHADYIIAETFFANTDWPINNCDFWRAHSNQVDTCGKYGDGRWRWILYDLDVAGESGATFDMLAYLSGNKMTADNEPAFLINKLWTNTGFRNYFVTRYANLLNTTFRPERLAALVNAAADEIAPEIEPHFRRCGRAYTQAQWRQAVDTALTQFTATRHSVSWQHLNAKFNLGGTGTLTVRNADASGAGGSLSVNGVPITPATDGVTNRADWTGTFFRSLAVPVQAIPDAGYVFDGWAGTALTDPAQTLFVSDAPVVLTARFRPAAAPPHVPTGYETWQLTNYTAQAIFGTTNALPASPSGFAGMSNFELYVFGMHLDDNLTDAQRRARAALSIHSRDGALWLTYTRLNDTFTDVNYTVKSVAALSPSNTWHNAVLSSGTLTNILDASTWLYEVRLPQPPPASGFFKLEVTPNP